MFMTVYPQVSIWILGITAVTLFWVALTDFREFRIRNELVVVLAGLYVLYALVSGRWVAMPWNIGFAVLMLAAMIYSYSRQQMGGGDLKLLAVAFLWTGPWDAVFFAILLLVFIGIHYVVVRLGWATSQQSTAGLRIPLAPSVAAALIGTFALGFVAPA
jgi:prepilin peptidase CpaA